MSHRPHPPRRPSSLPVGLRPLAAVLVVAGLLAAGPSPAGADATDPAPAGSGRTWVVDAVDDALGNRWVSEDTGTSEVSIEVGDTVEWQFDVGTAAIEHDLTSQDTGATWQPAVAEYRVPGDPPVRHTFTEPGVYHYLCSIHGTVMRGTVVVEEAGGQAPVVTAQAHPTTGTAPLAVHFTGLAEDPQGGDLDYAWDFGVAEAGDTAAGAEAAYTYADPGAYSATLTVTDADGNAGTDTVDVVVTGEDAELPSIEATATPSSAAAPAQVAFSTEVATDGVVAAFGDGLASYPDLAGTAALVRSRGETRASLEVSGLAPDAAHLVHVHEQACADGLGGAHFRFDEDEPFSAENEIWLPFTSDADGRSGLVEVTRPQRAGPRAVSVVVHDPTNPAQRIGCADLAPSTADLVYAWDFGDGTAGVGSDPDHTYADPGTYLATATVGRGHPGHTSGPTVTDSVEVVVVDADPPQTRIVEGPSGTVRRHRASFRLASSESGSSFACRLDGGSWDECSSHATFRGLAEGRHRLRVRATDGSGNTDATPAGRRWTVDTSAPVIGTVRPRGPVRDRTPMVSAVVTDRHPPVRRGDLALRVDGRAVPAGYDDRRDLLSWTPRRALAPGRHRVRLAAADAAGNRAAEVWWFRVLR